jgi:EmrB/QacA subfamily drug resistance transporter
MSYPYTGFLRQQQSGRALALSVLCACVLMIVLDATVVTVALPYIDKDLRFSAAVLSWVINAYLLTFGGLLLLGGRLGDLLGHRRVLLSGVALFSVSSLICGLATAKTSLLVGRGLQGIGAALISPAAIPIVSKLFKDYEGRSRALGILASVGATGGAAASLVGGLITGALNWRWIFYINLPVGLVVCAVGSRLLPENHIPGRSGSLDLVGALMGTLGLMFILYGAVNADNVGWLSLDTLASLTVATAFLTVFLLVEARVSTPLFPLGVLGQRDLLIACAATGLFAAAIFTWSFVTTLFLGRSLSYTPFAVGMAFLPANIVSAAASLGPSSWLAARFGIKRTLALGLLLATSGLLLLAQACASGSYRVYAMVGLFLCGLGGGVASNPLSLLALRSAPESDTGLASGVLNTSFVVGGSVGLALLASIAASHTRMALSLGVGLRASLDEGYQLAFVLAACFAMCGVACCARLSRS